MGFGNKEVGKEGGSPLFSTKEKRGLCKTKYKIAKLMAN